MTKLAKEWRMLDFFQTWNDRFQKHNDHWFFMNADGTTITATIKLDVRDCIKEAMAFAYNSITDEDRERWKKENPSHWSTTENYGPAIDNWIVLEGPPEKRPRHNSGTIQDPASQPPETTRGKSPDHLLGGDDQEG